MSELGNAGLNLASNIFGSLANNAISHIFNKDMNRTQYLQQQNLQHDSQKFLEHMYNLSKDYNTPSAQLQRLISAGINPNSAFGGVEGTTGTTQQPASSGIGSAPAAPYMPYSVANTDFSTFAKARKDTAEAVNQEIKNRYEDDKQRLSIDEATKRIEKYHSEIEELIERANLNETQAAVAWQMLPLQMTLARSQSAELQARARKTDQEVKQIDEQIKFIREQIETEKKKQSNFEANTTYVQLKQEEQRLINNRETAVTDLQVYIADELGLLPDKIGYDKNNLATISSIVSNIIDNIQGREAGEKGSHQIVVPRAQRRRNGSKD